MVNPLLTIAFDVLVVGGTVALFAAAVAQERMQRRGAVKASRPFRSRSATRSLSAATAVRPVRVRRRMAA